MISPLSPRYFDLLKGLKTFVTLLPCREQSIKIEIKAYTETPITSGLARKLIQKSTVLGVVTTASITKPVKVLMDEADIAWVENFPEAIVESPKR